MKIQQKPDLRPIKLVVTVPEKESGATAPAKLHKKNNKNNHCGKHGTQTEKQAG